MSPTNTTKPFFGMTTASAEFLHRHGIYYTRQDGNLSLFAEKSSTGRVLIYLLYLPGELRVISLTELQRLYPGVTAEATGLAKLPLGRVYEQPLGQLVYRDRYDDLDNHSGLVHEAYHAALSRGTTHATARWLGQYLIQDAFSGLGVEQQFTAEGIRCGREGFLSAETTVRRQLGLLQTAGTLTFVRDRSAPGFIIRYNKECLPSIAYELAPQFFSAICY